MSRKRILIYFLLSLNLYFCVLRIDLQKYELAISLMNKSISNKAEKKRLENLNIYLFIYFLAMLGGA